jgi:hypothetical protein
VNDIAWKALAAVTSLGAGVAARNVAVAVWRHELHEEPPANPADPGTSWPKAIAWTVALGGLVSVAQLAARRATAGAWRAATGDLPPGVGGSA